MGFKVNILGCGSASPSLSHLPACQVIEHNGHLYMIDCGEGAQLMMQRMHLSRGKLRHIFISHLHGDHIMGLPGLLSSLSLFDFGGEMHVYMHSAGIEVIKKSLEVFSHPPTYKLVFHPLETTRKVIYEDEAITIETFPLSHGIPANGFIFKEKPKLRRLKPSMIEYYKVPISKRMGIKQGQDFVTEDGRLIENKWLTMEPPHSASYAYASDTIMSQKVVEAVKGVDLLYHEATYGDDKAMNAKMRGHSTARQAAEVAQQAGVGQLLIGHFSSSYNGNEESLLSQAREVFPNTLLAKEGKSIEVG